MTKQFAKILIGFMMLAVAEVCSTNEEQAARVQRIMERAANGPAGSAVLTPAGSLPPTWPETHHMDATDGQGDTISMPGSERDSEIEEEEEPVQDIFQEMFLPTASEDIKWTKTEETRRGFPKKRFYDFKINLSGEVKISGTLNVRVNLIDAPIDLITDKNIQDLIDKKKKKQKMAQEKMLKQVLNQALMQQLVQDANNQSKRPRKRPGSRIKATKKQVMI